jgi:hypothetical protein
MSGNIAGLASYNGTGTQGTAVVDSPEREGEIMSTIWNKNDTTRQLITGTAVKELTPQGIVSENLNNTVTTFTIGNDVDVIGEMYLQVYATSTFNAGTTFNVSNLQFYSSISKVEILIGSQVWQTLTGFSMFVNSLLSPNAVPFYPSQAVILGGLGKTWTFILSLSGAFINTVSPINSNFSDQVNNGYLMAAASNQDMHIKVYWGNGSNIYFDNNFNGLPVNLKSCKMFCKQTTLCNFEREKIRSMVLPKRVIMTQTISQPVTIKSGISSYNFNINCDSFNIFASVLAIDLSMQSIVGLQDNGLSINTVELFLNGSSFSGPFTIELLQSPVFTTALNIYKSDTQTVLFFPLSNSLYGSGVPLNRFDNIRIVIKLTDFDFSYIQEKHDTLNVTAIGQSTVLYSGGAASLNKY